MSFITIVFMNNLITDIKKHMEYYYEIKQILYTKLLSPKQYGGIP